MPRALLAIAHASTMLTMSDGCQSFTVFTGKKTDRAIGFLVQALSVFIQGLGGGQHGINMTGHFDAPPFLAQNTVFVDQEGAAVHT